MKIKGKLFVTFFEGKVIKLSFTKSFLNFILSNKFAVLEDIFPVCVGIA